MSTEKTVNKITEFTRQSIFEEITPHQFPSDICLYGKVDEIDFFSRLYNLDNMPSYEDRHSNAKEDMIQHLRNNNDWDILWFLKNPRFNLLTSSDNIFIKFICEMLHPEVVYNNDYRKNFLETFNKFLLEDEYEIYESSKLSGRPLYSGREINKNSKNYLKKRAFQLKNGIESIITDGTWDNEEYQKLKTIFEEHQNLSKELPDFIVNNNDIFFIREMFQENGNISYKDRRNTLNTSFARLFKAIDEMNYDELKTLEPKKNWVKIGEGGFGIVYKAKHKYLDIDFALKIFEPHPFSEGSADEKRFLKEAKILFSLKHKNIITVYDFFYYEDKPTIKMEFFSGKNLNEILNKIGRLSLDKSKTLIKTVAKALNYAFEETGIVHRDLKPSNIMAAQKEQFRVIDFGLGIYIEEELQSRLTKTGERVASGNYTAPELSKDPKLIDIRCDIFSLGVIWYECLINRTPGGYGLKEALNDEIKEISNDYLNVVMKCLENNPSKRFQNYKELLDAIDKLDD